MDGTAEMILDFEQKYINGQLSIAGVVQPIPQDNCREIVLPEDINFEN